MAAGIMGYGNFKKAFLSLRNHPLVVAAIASVLVLGWQATTVKFNYGGNWSALFRIGDLWPLPPELRAEGDRVFVDDAGYDGTFYHMIAHDPWLSRGFARYVDNPSLRWRRILLPSMAHLAAFGADSRIHAAYIGVNLLFVFAGSYWLARFCAQNRCRPAWGLMFLAVPAVLVSMDRLTINTALSALLLGVIVYSTSHRRAVTLGLLALCPLARETGLCMVAGHAWVDAGKRQWKRLLLTLSAAVPFLVWMIFVSLHTTRDGTAWLSWPLAGILRRTLQPIPYAITGRWVAVAALLDYVALLGVWAGLILTVKLTFARRFGIIECSAYIFAVGAVWLGKEDIWGGAYEFGRTMSPLLLLLGLVAIRDRKPLFVLPLAMSVPRILLQLEPQLRGLFR